MYRILIILIISLLFSAFIAGDFRYVKNDSFTKGEVFEFRCHYGFFNAGIGKVEVSQKLYKINDRVCYKVKVYGKSIGAFDLFLRIRDTWISYIDTASMIPHISFRNIEEGRYRKNETVYFDQKNHTVEVVEKDEESKQYNVPENIQDMISAYYYLRTLDFDKFNIGDTIDLDAFFEDEIYNVKVKYMGKGKVKNKLGKFGAIKLIPVMPDNDLFEQGSSIRIWLSDDKNKIPVKIEADMFVGSVELDLKKYKGLRNELNVIKK